MSIHLVVREYRPWCDSCERAVDELRQKDIIGAFATHEAALAALLETEPKSPEGEGWERMGSDDPYLPDGVIEAWHVIGENVTEVDWPFEIIYIQAIGVQAGQLQSLVGTP